MELCNKFFVSLISIQFSLSHGTYMVAALLWSWHESGIVFLVAIVPLTPTPYPSVAFTDQQFSSDSTDELASRHFHSPCYLPSFDSYFNQTIELFVLAPTIISGPGAIVRLIKIFQR